MVGPELRAACMQRADAVSVAVMASASAEGVLLGARLGLRLRSTVCVLGHRVYSSGVGVSSPSKMAFMIDICAIVNWEAKAASARSDSVSPGE